MDRRGEATNTQTHTSAQNELYGRNGRCFIKLYVGPTRFGKINLRQGPEKQNTKHKNTTRQGTQFWHNKNIRNYAHATEKNMRIFVQYL